MIDQILLNNTDKIEIDVYYNGALTTPDSINIKQITDRDGIVRLSNQTVASGSSTGRYYFNVPASITDKLGTYTAIWEFVINSVTYNHTQYFEVTDNKTDNFTTVAQFRDETVLDFVTDDYPSDKNIEKHIKRASRLINRYLEGGIEYAQHSETVNCRIDHKTNGLVMQLKHRPIVSVTSVNVTTTPNSTVSLNVEDIRVNKKAGYIEYLYDFSMPHSLRACIQTKNRGIVPVATVSYTAGYTTIPEDITTATILLTEELLMKTFGQEQQITSIKINKDTYRYGDSKEVKKAKTMLGINNAEGIVNLIKKYRNYKPIISSPHTR